MKNTDQILYPQASSYKNIGRILIIIAVISTLGWCDDYNQKDSAICSSSQPSALQEIYRREGLLESYEKNCIFESIDNLRNEMKFKGIKSLLVVKENEAVPDNQGWAHCQYCGYKDDKFILFDSVDSNSSNNNSTTSSVDLSWSLWGEFFFDKRNDQLKGQIMTGEYLDLLLQKNNNNVSYYISRPVYILPMITMHVGHILIDVLEQVYRSMISNYGRVRMDALIVLDVAAESERNILQEKIIMNAYSRVYDNFASIITLLSELPIVSMQLFNQLSQEGLFIMFQDVHIGLDNSDSFYYKGYGMHPHIFPVHNQSMAIVRLSQRYLKFRDFIQEGARKRVLEKSKPGVKDTSSFHSFENTQSIKRVLFIQRENSRVLLNIDSLLEEAGSQNTVVNLVDLGRTSFSDQLNLFHNTDVLVATAGTSIHNIIFMRPGTSVIIIMQAGWCDWAWMYANQAVLLGIHYFLYCSDTNTTSTTTTNLSESDHLEKSNTNSLLNFHWTRKYWQQGPRMLKSENVTVDVNIFGKLLTSALIINSSNNKNNNDNRINDTDDEHGASKSPQEIKTSVCDTKICHTIDSENTTAEQSNKNTNTNTIDLFVSSIRIEETESVEGQSKAWKIALMGEFQSDERSAGTMIGSMPHLVVCIESMLSVSPYWCYPLEGLNYYSDIFLTVTNPVQLLHLWIQISEEGGKIGGSDVFYALDVRLPAGGLLVHSEAIGITLRDEIEVDMADGVDVSILFNQKLSNRRKVMFLQYISDRYSLQKATKSFCLQYQLNHLSCSRIAARLSSVAQKAILMRRMNMPAIQYIPTPEKPFVFIHIEKTGGTTMREFITESADHLGLEYFVPCHGGIHCVMLTLPTLKDKDSSSELLTNVDVNLRNISIVAGHFFWGVWQQLPSAAKVSMSINNSNSNRDSIRHSKSSKNNINKAVPPCLVIGRHPIDRAISYYYQRCYNSSGCIGYRKPINELTVEEMHVISNSIRHAGHINGDEEQPIVLLDEGIEDAACRALANEKVTTGMVVGVEPISLPPPVSVGVGDRAVANVEKCIVGILERWDETQFVINQWFPWIDFSQHSDRRKMFIYSGKETRVDIRPELRDVLMKFSVCDMRLYEKMQLLFEAQLSVMKTSYFAV